MRNGQNQNGYMTVEAALILPVMFAMYLFLIRSFFWVYDRCMLEQDMATLILRFVSVEDEEKENAWQQEISAWDREKYLWMSLNEPSIRMQGWKYQVTGQGECEEWGEWQVSYNVWHLTPEDWLRMKRKGEKGEIGD